MESSIEALPYRWPHDGNFVPKNTALIIIDMQQDCMLNFRCLDFFLSKIPTPHPTFSSHSYDMIKSLYSLQDLHSLFS
jgi:hypothetical protein